MAPSSESCSSSRPSWFVRTSELHDKRLSHFMPPFSEISPPEPRYSSPNSDNGSYGCLPAAQQSSVSEIRFHKSTQVPNPPCRGSKSFAAALSSMTMAPLSPITRTVAKVRGNLYLQDPSFVSSSMYLHLQIRNHVRQCPRSRAVRSFSLPLATHSSLTLPFRQDSLVTTEELSALVSKNNLVIPPSDLPDYAALLAGLNHCAKEILEIPDYYPTVDLSLYPRTDIHRPSGPIETDKGGWAWKATVKSTKPKSNELEGRTIALKDNVALAGVQCTNGTGAVDWVPNVDATLVTRILDAGGMITGKAACENNCFGAVRYGRSLKGSAVAGWANFKPVIPLSQVRFTTRTRTVTQPVDHLLDQVDLSPREQST